MTYAPQGIISLVLFVATGGLAVAAYSNSSRVPVSSNGRVSPFDHDPCSEYRARIDKDIQDAKNELSGKFQSITNEDLQGDLKQTMQGAGVKVIYEQ